MGTGGQIIKYHNLFTGQSSTRN